jgi:A/G-specific adenine glycosylase
MIRTQLDNKEDIQEALLTWYKSNKRDLPWRKTTDPYKIWVSEIMLQQTQVETVKGYYERFLKAFPTVEALALCDDDKLMKLWEGLGYYSRARNLKRAAYIIHTEYDDKMPNTQEQIRKLPGIGPYTAGAVLSIAFGLPEPAVDGNVIRVYSRLFSITDFVDKKEIKGLISDIADTLVHVGDPSSYNQSLMELGALVCTPRNPKCDTCPLKHKCLALEHGIQSELPKKAPKRAKKQVDLYAMVINKDDQFMIIKRPSAGLLQGLWSLPSVELERGSKEAVDPKSHCLDYLSDELGLEASFVKKMGSANHVFTHIKWFIHVFEFEWVSGKLPEFPDAKWVTRETLEDYALPTAYKKALVAASLL